MAIMIERKFGMRTVDKAPHFMGEVITFHDCALGAAASKKDTLIRLEPGPYSARRLTKDSAHKVRKMGRVRPESVAVENLSRHSILETGSEHMTFLYKCETNRTRYLGIIFNYNDGVRRRRR